MLIDLDFENIMDDRALESVKTYKFTQSVQLSPKWVVLAVIPFLDVSIVVC